MPASHLCPYCLENANSSHSTKAALEWVLPTGPSGPQGLAVMEPWRGAAGLSMDSGVGGPRRWSLGSSWSQEVFFTHLLTVSFFPANRKAWMVLPAAVQGRALQGSSGATRGVCCVVSLADCPPGPDLPRLCLPPQGLLSSPKGSLPPCPESCPARAVPCFVCICIQILSENFLSSVTVRALSSQILKRLKAELWAGVSLKGKRPL